MTQIVDGRRASKTEESIAKLQDQCLQLRTEHEWIVRKLDERCAPADLVDELYKEVENIHHELDLRFRPETRKKSAMSRTSLLEKIHAEQEKLRVRVENELVQKIEETIVPQIVSLDESRNRSSDKQDLLQDQLDKTKERLAELEAQLRAGSSIRSAIVRDVVKEFCEGMPSEMDAHIRQHVVNATESVAKEAAEPVLKKFEEEFMQRHDELDDKYTAISENLIQFSKSMESLGVKLQNHSITLNEKVSAMEDQNQRVAEIVPEMEKQQKTVMERLAMLDGNVTDWNNLESKLDDKLALHKSDTIGQLSEIRGETDGKLAELIKRMNSSLLRLRERDEEAIDAKLDRVKRDLDWYFKPKILDNCSLFVDDMQNQNGFQPQKQSSKRSTDASTSKSTLQNNKFRQNYYRTRQRGNSADNSMLNPASNQNMNPNVSQPQLTDVSSMIPNLVPHMKSDAWNAIVKEKMEQHTVQLRNLERKSSKLEKKVELAEQNIDRAITNLGRALQDVQEMVKNYSKVAAKSMSDASENIDKILDKTQDTIENTSKFQSRNTNDLLRDVEKEPDIEKECETVPNPVDTDGRHSASVSEDVAHIVSLYSRSAAPPEPSSSVHALLKDAGQLFDTFLDIIPKAGPQQNAFQQTSSTQIRDKSQVPEESQVLEAPAKRPSTGKLERKSLSAAQKEATEKRAAEALERQQKVDEDERQTQLLNEKLAYIEKLEQQLQYAKISADATNKSGFAYLSAPLGNVSAESANLAGLSPKSAVPVGNVSAPMSAPAPLPPGPGTNASAAPSSGVSVPAPTMEKESGQRMGSPSSSSDEDVFFHAYLQVSSNDMIHDLLLKLQDIQKDLNTESLENSNDMNDIILAVEKLDLATDKFEAAVRQRLVRTVQSKVSLARKAPEVIRVQPGEQIDVESFLRARALAVSAMMALNDEVLLAEKQVTSTLQQRHAEILRETGNTGQSITTSTVQSKTTSLVQTLPALDLSVNAAGKNVASDVASSAPPKPRGAGKPPLPSPKTTEPTQGPATKSVPPKVKPVPKESSENAEPATLEPHKPGAPSEPSSGEKNLSNQPNPGRASPSSAESSKNQPNMRFYNDQASPADSEAQFSDEEPLQSKVEQQRAAAQAKANERKKLEQQKLEEKRLQEQKLDEEKRLHAEKIKQKRIQDEELKQQRLEEQRREQQRVREDHEQTLREKKLQEQKITKQKLQEKQSEQQRLLEEKKRKAQALQELEKRKAEEQQREQDARLKEQEIRKQKLEEENAKATQHKPHAKNITHTSVLVKDSNQKMGVAKSGNLPGPIYVKFVLPDSAAAKAGIQIGMRIVAVNGERSLSEESYLQRMTERPLEVLFDTRIDPNSPVSPLMRSPTNPLVVNDQQGNLFLIPATGDLDAKAKEIDVLRAKVNAIRKDAATAAPQNAAVSSPQEQDSPSGADSDYHSQSQSCSQNGSAIDGSAIDGVSPTESSYSSHSATVSHSSGRSRGSVSQSANDEVVNRRKNNRNTSGGNPVETKGKPVPKGGAPREGKGKQKGTGKAKKQGKGYSSTTRIDMMPMEGIHQQEMSADESVSESLLGTSELLESTELLEELEESTGRSASKKTSKTRTSLKTRANIRTNLSVTSTLKRDRVRGTRIADRGDASSG